MNTSKNFLSPTITPKMVGRSLQTSRISMFALAAFSLLLLPTALISETRVTWSAIDRGIATDVGTPLSPGSLVRLGSFDLTPAQIVSNASDITYLN